MAKNTGPVCLVVGCVSRVPYSSRFTRCEDHATTCVCGRAEIDPASIIGKCHECTKGTVRAITKTVPAQQAQTASPRQSAATARRLRPFSKNAAP